MHEILVTGLPPERGDIKGCWYNGYPVHRGYSEESLNYATVLANKEGIIPDQEKLREEWNNLVYSLQNAGFLVHILPFPEQLNQPDCICHDAVFVRDAGMMYGDYWIQGRFAAENRGEEAKVYAEIIPDAFQKKLMKIPQETNLEFGEVFYLQTEQGSYYFGGLSRSTREAHEFMRELLSPDYFLLVSSVGYHLDTVFTPVLSPNNTLAAIMIAPEMIYPQSLEALETLDTEIIPLDPVDSSGQGESLGNYAVNTLVSPGKMLNCCTFETAKVENRLHALGIERFLIPMKFFKYAGGSVHCLTNEIYR